MPSINPKDYDAIFTLRRSGLTLKEIAARYGVSSNTVRIICAENNVYPPAPAGNHYFWNTERDEDLVTRWNRGDCITDIARHFDRTEGAINSHLSILKRQGYHITLRNNGVRYAITGGVYYKRGC